MGRRTSIHDFRLMKERGEKIVMVTCYDYTGARIIAPCGFPAVLVGDSLGMVVCGQDSTLRVGIEAMIHHCQAVSRGIDKALIVIDLPFGTYSASDLPLSLHTARRAMAEGRAHAVKIEGGRRMVPVVKTLIASGIPVMGHIGLTPQSIHVLGGHRVQGRDEQTAERLIAAAQALEKAGVFAVVLECVPAGLAQRITATLAIPTIGIGAGPCCDGQIQVFHDLMGLYEDSLPRHAKRYCCAAADLMREAAGRYLAEARSGSFPGPEHSFDMEGLFKTGGEDAHPVTG